MRQEMEKRGENCVQSASLLLTRRGFEVLAAAVRLCGRPAALITAWRGRERQGQEAVRKCLLIRETLWYNKGAAASTSNNFGGFVKIKWPTQM